MRRAALLAPFAIAFAALALPAAAQPTRDHLAPINGVAFGDKFEKIRGQLGANFEEGTAADDKMTNILVGSAPLFSKTFSITYAFGDGGQLDRANAVAELDTTEDAVCKTHWTSVLASATAAFGKPDHQEDKTSATPPTASVEFDYKDGGLVRGVLLGCLIQFDWSARPAKD